MLDFLKISACFILVYILCQFLYLQLPFDKSTVTYNQGFLMFNLVQIN